MKIVLITVAAMLAGLLWRHWSLCIDYEREQAAHAQTRTELATALAEGQRWQAVAGETLLAAESQKQLAEACLARESESRADEEARKLILAQSKPRPRLPEERDKVVDDATRTRAVSRLNRPL